MNAIYHPTASARLPVPSDTDIIFFTDASCTKQRTPKVCYAPVRVTRCADGHQVEHHTGATKFGASSNSELRTVADTVIATPPPTSIRPRNIWVVVDAMVDVHLTSRLPEVPPHRVLESGLSTKSLGLWMAFRGMHFQDALHIVKQESQRYTYGNGRADTHAKHQNTNHTPGLEHVRLDTTHHSHLQYPPSDTLSNTAPPLDTRGHAIHGQRQTVPLLHAHPTPRHHTGPPVEHRAPGTPQSVRPYRPLLLSPLPGEPPSTPAKTPTQTCPRAASPPHPVLAMVLTRLNPRPRTVHQMHLWPHRGRNRGQLQDVPPVPAARHPHRPDHSQHHCTTHQMADAVPGNSKTRHHPPADRGTRGGPQGSHPHCRLHHANRETPPSDLPPDARAPRPSSRTIHHKGDRHRRHELHRHRTHTHQHAHTGSPHAPTPRSVRRFPQPRVTACPLYVRQWLPQTGLDCNPNHWICLGAAHSLSHCPHCGDLNPHHRAQPATQAAPLGQPAQLLRATHRHPPGLPWRVLRGSPGRPCVDHCHGHGRRTPAPPQPATTPQRGRLQRGGPPHPSHPVPAPPWPPPLGPIAPDSLRSSPGAGKVGRDGTRGGGRLHPAHLLPVQHRFWPAERGSLPTQRAHLRSTPPSHTAEGPAELGAFLGHPPGRPQ